MAAASEKILLHDAPHHIAMYICLYKPNEASIFLFIGIREFFYNSRAGGGNKKKKNKIHQSPSPSVIFLDLSLLVFHGVFLLILQLVTLTLQLSVDPLQLAVLTAQSLYLLIQSETHSFQLSLLIASDIQSGLEAVGTALGIISTSHTDITIGQYLTL